MAGIGRYTLQMFVTKPALPMFENLDLLLKARYCNYLCKEILCVKPFFKEILFYLKGNRGLLAILRWHILTQVL